MKLIVLSGLFVIAASVAVAQQEESTSEAAARRHKEAIVEAVVGLQRTHGIAPAVPQQLGRMPNTMVVEPLLTDRQPSNSSTFDHYRLADKMICVVPNNLFIFNMPIFGTAYLQKPIGFLSPK